VRQGKKSWKVAGGLLFAIALIAASCGDDGDAADTDSPTTTRAITAATTPPTTGTAAVATVAGCEKRGYTDPKDRSDTRQVARCDPNTPAPKPLATETTVKIGTNFRLEFNSPIAIADALGEFKKENLKIELVNLSYANSVPQMANGQIDIAVGGFEIAMFNAGNAGLPIRVVLGNYYPPKASNYSVAQTGLWCRRDSFTTPATPKLKEMETMKWATAAGRGSSAMYYSVAEILKREPTFDYKKVDTQIIGSNDIPLALRNKAINCGILLDPVWVDFATDPGYVQVATQTPGEPLGHMSFGKSLLQDKKEVGDAFVRAYIRTINTYYNGDYHKDAKVMAEIQKFTGQAPEVFSKLASLDSLTFDWEVRDGTLTDIQKLFLEFNLMPDLKSGPVPEDKLIDRSFYQRAVGAIVK
jgi:NitT/TauT family transport system substrate-binding protein